MVKDSLEYAKEALIGKWGRWITFIILALPMALVQFVFDPEKLINKTTGDINWALVPWDQLAVLMVIGIPLGFFLAGYMVRVFRGVKPAPDFDNWAGLFIDGLKLNIVWFLWFLPCLVVMVASIGMMVISLGKCKGPGRFHGPDLPGLHAPARHCRNPCPHCKPVQLPGIGTVRPHREHS